VFVRTLLVFLLTGLCWPLQARAEETSVAILDFTSKGAVSSSQVAALADQITSEIHKIKGYRAIGAADIRALLDLETRKIMMGCNEDSCLAEIGGALGVELLVTGNITAFGESILLNLKLLDVKNVKVVKALSERVEGGAAELLEVVPASVRALFGLPDSPAESDWFEVELRVQFLESLLAENLSAASWWESNKYSQFGVWNDRWTGLHQSDEIEARGGSTGKGWGLGAKFGMRFTNLHLVFIQLDIIQEHWRGKAEVDLDLDSAAWEIHADLTLLRLLAGYRFSYPILEWLAPFVELAVGTTLVIPKKANLVSEAVDHGQINLAVSPRFTVMVAPGIQFRFAQRYHVGLAYLFDLPLGSNLSSGITLSTGAHF